MCRQDLWMWLMWTGPVWCPSRSRSRGQQGQRCSGSPRGPCFLGRASPSDLLGLSSWSRSERCASLNWMTPKVNFTHHATLKLLIQGLCKVLKMCYIITIVFSGWAICLNSEILAKCLFSIMRCPQHNHSCKHICFFTWCQNNHDHNIQVNINSW